MALSHVTSQKQRNFKKSNSLFDSPQHFFDHLTEAFILYDKDWNYLYVNKAAGKIIGKGPEDLLGKNAWKHFPESRRTELGKNFLHAVKTRKNHSFQTFYQPLQKWFDVQIYPYNEGLATCFHDITTLKRIEESLSESEQRLQFSLESGNGGGWEWNLETGEVWYSAAMYKLWGIPIGTPLTTKSSMKYIDPQDQQVIRKILEMNFEKVLTFKYEFRFDHPVLGQRWMESRGKVIRRQNKAIRAIGITVDITERKNIQEALRESEERFRATFYQTTIPMSLADTNGNWIEFNTAYPKLFGYTKKELQQKSPAELLHPDDLVKSKEAFQKLLDGKIPTLTQERRYIHKNGSIIFGIVNATIVKDTNGKARYVVTIVEDITERKKSEENLKASEERFRTLIEQSTDVIQLINADGKILYTSNSIRHVLGYSPKEIMGKNGAPYLHPEDAERFYTVFSHLLEKSGNQVTLEYRLKHKNGSWKWIEATGVNHLNNPMVHAIVGNFRDITQRKLLEKQKDEFLGIASHELKTPVTSLKAYAQILQNRFEKAGDENAAQMLGKMDAQINKLTHLIQDLLDVSKVESGRLKMHMSSFDLDALIEEIGEEVQRTTMTHVINIKGKTGKKIYADRDRVGQVLTNFLTNAIKYSPRKSKIIISTKVTSQDVTVAVKDNGVGIAKEHLPHIFDRFFRASGPGHDTVPGMGLGLNIASEIIKRHQGKIWAESSVGKGSTFSFTLPLGEQPNREE